MAVTNEGSHTNATVRAIEAIELFRGCTPSQLQIIERLGSTLVAEPCRTLCSEGDVGSEFFVLVDGVAEVRNAGRRVALLHAGAWFGEASLVSTRYRLADILTVVESTLIVFHRAEFDELCRAAPQVRERLEAMAALYAQGWAPASKPWYQPIDTTTRTGATSDDRGDEGTHTHDPLLVEPTRPVTQRL